MSRVRRGFTMIELLTVLIVLALLSGLAILRYIDLRNRALAVQASADLETVRLAAYSAWYETGNWPADAGPGVMPPELASYLPGGFSFQRNEYSLDWENFAPPGGGPSGGMQIGVVLSASTTRMSNTLVQVLGNKTPFVVNGDEITYVIVGPDGRS
ncbi:MAG TPA: prepilin-type N-terminal cleavage/methylation domain-containing protein [Gemmatimonadales bacterium]|jgi:prepilin-type N-terminal cleavage/methylation domain-containing protein|nr:prepilin-type N-terminal cleavage/methylation domain-containing protein [Gemmatimonadales bacterium]